MGIEQSWGARLCGRGIWAELGQEIDSVHEGMPGVGITVRWCMGRGGGVGGGWEGGGLVR